MSDAKVPSELNDFQQYHSKCYRAFTALPPKYRKCMESTTIPTIANVTGEADQLDQSGPSGQYAEAATVPQYQTDNLDIEENEAAATQHDPDSAEKPSDYSCIFLPKKKKKIPWP
ncbi:hypothetical protein EVAR_21758_1 [Eumeta japonica]|uniref:Uncharacterized protein n=1 Tax=Eumeta variegata TaxID=151549 RepID=A0A4C1ZKY4_EUMVA|nr:hypothetical protein EVAR_21758_1 [Eumeta japonica]